MRTVADTWIDAPIFNAQSNTSSMFDGAVGDNGFMVTWYHRDDSAGIYAARVASDGTLLDPGAILVARQPDLLGPQMLGIAFGAGKYLIVWDNEPGSKTINGALLSADGTILKPSFRIADTTYGAAAAKVVWDGTNFALFWNDETFKQTLAIRIRPDGQPVETDPVRVNTIEFPARKLDSAWNGTVHALVSIVNSRIEVRRVRANFSPSGESPVQLTPQRLDSIFGAAIVWSGTHYTVAWVRRSETLGVVDIVGVRLDANLTVLDTEPIVLIAGRKVETGPVGAWTGAKTLLSWIDKTENDERRARVASVTFNGGVATVIEFAASSSVLPRDNPADNSALRCSNQTCLALWSQTELSRNQVWMNRVASDGSMKDGNGFLVSTFANEQLAPVIFPIPSGFQVVYSDSRTFPSPEIRTRSFATGNAPLDASIAIKDRSIFDPGLWSKMGDRTLYLWKEHYPKTTFYATRFDRDGKQMPGVLDISTVIFPSANLILSNNGKRWVVIGGTVGNLLIDDGSGTLTGSVTDFARPTLSESASRGAHLLWIQDHFLLIWSENDKLSGHFLNPDGLFLPRSPAFKIADMKTGVISAAIGPDRIAVANLHFSNGMAELWVVLLNLNGQIIRPPTLVEGGLIAGTGPQVGWDGSAFVVVYPTGFVSGVQTDLLYRRIRSDGAIETTSQQLMKSAGVSHGHPLSPANIGPTVAFSGKDNLAAVAYESLDDAPNVRRKRIRLKSVVFDDVPIYDSFSYTQTGGSGGSMNGGGTGGGVGGTAGVGGMSGGAGGTTGMGASPGSNEGGMSGGAGSIGGEAGMATLEGGNDGSMPANSSSGCGCRVGGRSQSGFAIAVPFVFALVRRCRRRPGRSRPEAAGRTCARTRD